MNSAISRCFRTENGAPAGNADALRLMPARPPCHADIAAASGISDVPAKDVISRAAAGDPLADRVFTEAITALGRALVNYVLLMDPELILIGGGMAASGAALLHPLTREVQAGLAWRPAPTISNGRFAGDAGRQGAGLLAWRALQESRCTDPVQSAVSSLGGRPACGAVKLDELLRRSWRPEAPCRHANAR